MLIHAQYCALIVVLYCTVRHNPLRHVMYYPGCIAMVEFTNFVAFKPFINDGYLLCYSMFARELNIIDREPATSAELHVLFYVSPNCQNGGTSNYTILASDGAITSLFFKVPCECQYGWAGMYIS